MARADVHSECNDGGLEALSLGLGSTGRLGLLRLGLLLLGVHGNLHRDWSSTNLLALKQFDGLGLAGLVANIDEAVTLALARLAPTAANDTRGIDGDASVSEDSSKLLVANGEAKVGNKEHSLGWLSSGLLACGALRAGSTSLALTGPLSFTVNSVALGILSESGSVTVF